MSQPPPCPYCGATSYQLKDQRWLVCRECQNEFDLQHDLCRSCGSLNQSGEKACAQCGKPLKRDTVDQLITERGRDERAWRERKRTAGAGQKQTEEQASQQRMAAYWAEDRARREAVARGLAERRTREKKVAIIVLIGVAIVILALVATMVFLSLNRDPVSMLHAAAPQEIPLVQHWIAGIRQIGPG